MASDALDREDVAAIIRGSFGMRAFLSDIAADVAVIRGRLESDDDEEDQDG